MDNVCPCFCNNCENYNVTGVDFEDTTPDIMGYINQVVAETNQGKFIN